ncbi:MAG: DUF2846 domain-containing protein [Bacteroidota bacterium]|nr:DUF2846 domain-containing protein [Bacteroidota bacterium]
MGTGKLILYRKKNFNGLAVGMDVYINDTLYGKMASGEKKEFDLEPGTYKIRVQQNIKSGEQDVIIEAGKTISYAFYPSMLSLVSFVSPLIGLGLLFLFKISLSLAALILLPGAITAIYLLTAGKTKYFLFSKSK